MDYASSCAKMRMKVKVNPRIRVRAYATYRISLRWGCLSCLARDDVRSIGCVFTPWRARGSPDPDPLRVLVRSLTGSHPARRAARSLTRSKTKNKIKDKEQDKDKERRGGPSLGIGTGHGKKWIEPEPTRRA